MVRKFSLFAKELIIYFKQNKTPKVRKENYYVHIDHFKIFVKKNTLHVKTNVL